MSEYNIGSQSQTFDFRLPIKASKFNRILRSITKPGVYKGLTLSFSGFTVIVDSGSALFNCFFNGNNNLAMKIDFDSIIIQENVLQSSFGENEVVYLTYEYGDIIDNFADLKFTPLSNWLSAPKTNAIVLGEIEFNPLPPYNITGVNYTRKTWGLTNVDVDDSINDEVVYVDTDNYLKKWKLKGGNLSNNTTILDFQSLSQSAARVPLTNSTNTMIVENKLTIGSSEESTTKDNGGLVLDGGLGVEKSITVGLNASITERLSAGKFDGRVPLGAVIPIVGTRTEIDNAGTPITPSGIPSSGIISNDGFQLCDGSAVGSGSILTGFVPNLTDSRFIQGSTSLGTIGGNTSNQVSLGITNIPSHNHSIYDPGHSHNVTGNINASVYTNYDGNHRHNIFTSNIVSSPNLRDVASPQTRTAAVEGVIGSDVASYRVQAGTIEPTLGMTSTPKNTLTLVDEAIHRHIVDISTTLTSGNAGTVGTGILINNTGDGTAFDIRPLYMTAIYVMRVR